MLMRQFYSPKKIIFFLAFSALCLIAKKTSSYASGPPTAYTGAPGESDCTSCHSGTSLNGGAFNSGIKILSNMPNGRYAANTTYHMTVRLITHNCVKFGFEVTSLNSASTAAAGSFTVTDFTRTQKNISGSRQYMEQTFSGTSASSTDSTDWTFDWTSPLSTTQGNAIFYLAGNVTNNNSNSNGDTIYTKSFTFPPYILSVATINASSINICTNDSVKFTAGANNSPTGYSWTFPNGIPSTSTQQVQWVKFPNAGLSLCSLYVTNASGTSALVTKNITINSYPTSSITTTGTTTFCQGDSVLLTGNTGTGYSYLWLLDGVSTGLTNNPLNAKAGGNYTLRVTGPGGCSVVSGSVPVIVNPKPSALLTSTGPVAFCNGDSVLLKLTGSSGTSKEWYNGSALITGISDTFYYAKTTGTYSVKLTNSSNCSTISDTITVSVNNYPTASFTSAPSGCTFILTANSASNYRYQWYKNDTAMANDTNITHTINSNGTYKVRVTNASGCSVYSSSQTMNVTNLPDVSLSINGNTAFCIGDSVTLSVPQNSLYSYRWFKNGNVLPNDTLQKLIVKDSGDYLVNVSNSTCTNISNATPIKVLAYPDASIIANNTVICDGDSALLTAKTGVGYSYQWYKNDTLLTGQTVSSLVINKEGNYNVNISNGHCNQNGNKIFVKVNSLPAIPIISRDKQTLTSTSALHYQWYKDGNLIAGASSQSYTPTADAKYKVMVIDINGCSNSSADYNYALVGITSNINPITIRIYPIPADQSITVESTMDNTFHLKVFDGCGKIMFDDNISEPKTKIDVSTWSKGIYMMYVEEGENNRMVKFIISR
jgi:hypothetical protein